MKEGRIMYYQIKNLKKSFGEYQVLDDINVTFECDTVIAIIGESGVGKSTFLNCISGLDKSDAGNCQIFDNDAVCTQEFNMNDANQMTIFCEQNIAFIFQEHYLLDELTVIENILAVTQITEKQSAHKKYAEYILERVEMLEYKDQKVKDLSGGQKSRCSIARALMVDRPIILADEPTGSLDAETARTVLELLIRVAKDKVLILVTHDLDVVQYADVCYQLQSGKLTLEDNKKTQIPKQLVLQKMPFYSKNKAVTNLVGLQLKLAFQNIWKQIGSIFIMLLLSLFIMLSLNIEQVTHQLYNEQVNTSTQLRTLEFTPNYIDGKSFISYDDIVHIGTDVDVEKVIPQYQQYNITTQDNLILHTELGNVTRTEELKFHLLYDDEMVPVRTSTVLLSGKLPGKTNEIVLSKHLAEDMGETDSTILNKSLTIRFNIPISQSLAEGNKEKNAIEHGTLTVIHEETFIVVGVFRNSTISEINFGGFGDANIGLPIEYLNNLLENTNQETLELLRADKIMVVSDSHINVPKLSDTFKDKFQIKDHQDLLQTINQSVKTVTTLFRIITVVSLILFIAIIAVFCYFSYLHKQTIIGVLKAFGASRNQIFIMSNIDFVLNFLVASVLLFVLLPIVEVGINQSQILTNLLPQINSVITFTINIKIVAILYGLLTLIFTVIIVIYSSYAAKILPINVLKSND